MATPRHAKICIRNNTARVLKAVSLRHRGDGGRTHTAQWSDVAEGATTSATQIGYETNLLAAGTDWWLIAWVYANDDEIYVTDPSNVAEAVRSARERLAQVMPDFAGRLASAPASTEVEQVLDTITDEVVNEPRLSGWQHHALSRAEADRTMLIEIEPNNDVVFTSRSGRSRTSTMRSPLASIDRTMLRAVD